MSELQEQVTLERQRSEIIIRDLRHLVEQRASIKPTAWPNEVIQLYHRYADATPSASTSSSTSSSASGHAARSNDDDSFRRQGYPFS